MDRLPTFAGDHFFRESGPKASFWYDFLGIVVCIAMGILALSIGQSHLVGNWGVETDFYGAYAPHALNIVYSEHEAKYWEGLKALSNPVHVSKSFRLIFLTCSDQDPGLRNPKVIGCSLGECIVIGMCT
jgi:hypothetical protein